MKATTEKKKGLKGREVDIEIRGVPSTECGCHWSSTHGITTRELLGTLEDKCLDVDCWLSKLWMEDGDGLCLGDFTSSLGDFTGQLSTKSAG